MKLEQLLNEWLNRYIYKTKSESNSRCYYYSVKRILEHESMISKKSISKIKEVDIQELVNMLSKKYSHSSLKKIKITFALAFKYAYKNGYIKNNINFDIQIPKTARMKVVNALTIFEQNRVEEVCCNDSLGHIVIFLLRTGLRANELCSLKWSDYNSNTQTINIRKSKTEAGIREVPLCRDARFIVEYLKSSRTHEYVFSNSKGDRLTYHSLRRITERLRKETGFKHFSPHVCRHTFATRLVEKGVDYKALSELLGHTDVAFTLQRYATVDYNFLKLQVSLLD